MDFEGSHPLFPINRENIDFGSIFRSSVEEQRQEVTLPPLPSSSFEPIPSDVPQIGNFSGSLMNLLEAQQAEMDQYLQMQNVRLGESLFKQRKRHIESLKSHLEHNTFVILKMKDDRLEMLNLQCLRLCENLKKSEELKEAWQRIANEKGAMISSLTSTLEQLLQQTQISSANEAVKIEHCSDSSNEGKGEQVPSKVSYHVSAPCMCCGFRNACMLLFPCRHLCACKHCEALLSVCPICGSAKTETVEVLVD